MSAELSERIAGAVLAHPAVAGLAAGPFGAVSSYLPGRRVDGVRIAEDGSAVELGVTLRFGRPIPAVAEQLRATVREIAGDVRVDLTVLDLTDRDPEPQQLQTTQEVHP